MNKFNIRDTVWLIYGDKVCSQTVAAIFDKDPKSGDPRKHQISYHLYLDEQCVGMSTFTPESRLYRTKEELLKSL